MNPIAFPPCKHSLPDGSVWTGTTNLTLTCSFCEFEKMQAERDELRAEVARLTAERDASYARGLKRAAQLCAEFREHVPIVPGREKAQQALSLVADLIRHEASPDPSALPIGSHPTVEYRPEDSAAFGDDGGSVRKEKG